MYNARSITDTVLSRSGLGSVTRAPSSFDPPVDLTASIAIPVDRHESSGKHVRLEPGLVPATFRISDRHQIHLGRTRIDPSPGIDVIENPNWLCFNLSTLRTRRWASPTANTDGQSAPASVPSLQRSMRVLRARRLNHHLSSSMPRPHHLLPLSLALAT